MQVLDPSQLGDVKLGLLSRMSRLKCVRGTLRLALEELEQSAALFAKPSGWQQLWERYVSSKLDYRAEARTLQEKMNQAGVDGLQLLEWSGKLSDARSPWS